MQIQRKFPKSQFAAAGEQIKTLAADTLQK